LTRSIIVGFDQQILDLVKIGQKIEPNDPLVLIQDVSAGTSDEFDAQAKQILKQLRRRAPKSKYRGTVGKIEIFYNGELKDMTKSLRTAAEESDKRLASDHNDSSLTGQVTSEYSIRGVPLAPEQAEIKIYIEVQEPAGIGDKGIFANQMKTTIGEVYDYPIVDENGEDIEAIFGERSIQARTVISPKLIGTTTTILKLLAREAVKAYKK
jgi:hypothetical protein